MRQELKNPLGQLITGSPKETMRKLKQLIKKEKPVKIIAVGDVVTNNMRAHQIPTHITIVDNKVLRENIKPSKVRVKTTMHLRNSPATIAKEAWTIVKEAFDRDQPVHVVVDGEDDLLTLVAVLLAPKNSLVIYGQPNQGVVAVKTTDEPRRKVQVIIDAMQPLVEKSK
jgi:uncharacterized protein (UPF0218 family)